MLIQQLSVFLENRAGQLAEITGLLAERGIDLRAINIADTKDYGVLRMLVSDPAAAAQALEAHGFIFSQTQLVAVHVPDQPGGLNAVLQLAAKENIDIAYMYSVFGTEAGTAVMAMCVSEPDRFSALAEKYEKNLQK